MTTAARLTDSTNVPWTEPPTAEEILARIDELGPGWRERRRALDEAVEFPHENFAEAKAAGLHALTLPTEYGGAGVWLPGRYSHWYEALEDRKSVV